VPGRVPEDLPVSSSPLYVSVAPAWIYRVSLHSGLLFSVQHHTERTRAHIIGVTETARERVGRNSLKERASPRSDRRGRESPALWRGVMLRHERAP
jgi:hypothetical protein